MLRDIRTSLKPSQEHLVESMSINLKQDAAEQVRAHLVMVRGGAPFLSPIDSKLLVEWLDSSVPVDVILTAIEEVASRRSKSRLKSPLSLRAVKGVVKKGLKKSAKPADTTALRRLVLRLESAQDSLLQALATDFSALEDENLDGTALLAAVLELARGFHERAWEHSDQQGLKAQAEKELEDLRDMLSEERYKSAIEEVARDNLRKRYKLLSAPTLSQAFRP